MTRLDARFTQRPLRRTPWFTAERLVVEAIRLLGELVEKPPVRHD